MDIKIHLAEVSDLQNIIALHLKTWADSYQNYIPKKIIEQHSKITEERLCSMREKIENNLVYVVENNMKIIGFACLANAIVNQETEIKQLYIDRDYQRKGIGQKLLKHLFYDLKKKGCQRVFLWTLKNYEKSNSFYQKNGGVLTGAEKRLKINVDTVQFSFHLTEKD